MQSIEAALDCLDYLSKTSTYVFVYLTMTFNTLEEMSTSIEEIQNSYFLKFFLFYVYLCRPSEANTQYCAVLGSNPPKDWQSLPCAGEKPDSNPGLLQFEPWTTAVRTWNYFNSNLGLLRNTEAVAKCNQTLAVWKLFLCPYALKRRNMCSPYGHDS